MRISKGTWILAGICFGSCCAFATRPNTLVQLVVMASTLAALIALAILGIQGAIKWRERGLANLLSCLLIVLSFPAGVLVGQAIRSSIFAHDLARWNQAAAWVIANKAPNAGASMELPPQFSDLAHLVHYKTDESCGLMIDFFWGGGFPVKHTVRRYATNPEWMDIRECQAHWSRGRHLAGDWYEISD